MNDTQTIILEMIRDNQKRIAILKSAKHRSTKDYDPEETKLEIQSLVRENNELVDTL